MAEDRADVLVQETGIEQFANDDAESAGGMEVVHVGDAVGVDTRQQRHGGGQFGKVAPVDRDPGGFRDRDQVDRVIRRAAGCEQADDGVDDRFLVDHLAERDVVVAEVRVTQHAAHGLKGQLLAQRRAGVDERAARQLQAHELHEHLVAVGRAVEGAGALCMVRSRFGLQQFIPANTARGERLTRTCFFLVRDAGHHGPRRHEDRRQVAERQGPDQHARHDLVADTEVHGRVEHFVRQGHGRRQRDDVAAEQRQVHAVLALGDAVAHRGHAAGDLRDGAIFGGCALDLLGIGRVRLVRAEHVVVGGDDAEIGHLASRNGLLLDLRGRRHRMREVAARSVLPCRSPVRRLADALQVRGAFGPAALDDAPGYMLDGRVHFKGPSRR